MALNLSLLFFDQPVIHGGFVVEAGEVGWGEAAGMIDREEGEVGEFEAGGCSDRTGGDGCDASGDFSGGEWSVEAAEELGFVATEHLVGVGEGGDGVVGFGEAEFLGDFGGHRLVQQLIERSPGWGGSG